VGLVPFDKLLDVFWYLSQLKIAAPPDFMGNILGDIPGPTFRRIETDDPHWAVVLSIQHVGDK
jgi:hypothetical protein